MGSCEKGRLESKVVRYVGLKHPWAPMISFPEIPRRVFGLQSNGMVGPRPVTPHDGTTNYCVRYRIRSQPC
jgi:hypothetical protein